MPHDWPDPPLFARHVLEDPWTLAIALVAAGVALFVLGGRIGRRRLQLLAALPVALAAGAILAAHLVETEREQMLAAAHDLVDAAVTPFDTDYVELITDPAFTMTAGGEPDGPVIVANRQDLLATIERAQRTITIRSGRITHDAARSDGPGEGRTYVAVFNEAVSPMGKGLGKSQWVLHWRRGGNGVWMLTRAQCISINDRPVGRSLVP